MLVVTASVFGLSVAVLDGEMHGSNSFHYFQSLLPKTLPLIIIDFSLNILQLLIYSLKVVIFAIML